MLLSTHCVAGTVTLHAIYIGDSDAADIGSAVQYDLSNVDDEIERIVRYTGVKVKKTLFAGSNARIGLVIDRLEDMKVANHDLIILYFSGHGYRVRANGDSPWPNLYFHHEASGVQLELILELLRGKMARLTVVLVDCCNNLLSDYSAPPVRKALYTVGSLERGYRKLFLEAAGFITIASCDVGQTSLALANGSLYTLTFIDVLHEMLRLPASQANWQVILETAGRQTSKSATFYNDEQDPIFKIEAALNH
jgi:hypothetical protein